MLKEELNVYMLLLKLIFKKARDRKLEASTFDPQNSKIVSS